MDVIQFIPTGEHRPPKVGEWFMNDEKFTQQAMFDFQATSFDIVCMVKKDKDLKCYNGCDTTELFKCRFCHEKFCYDCMYEDDICSGCESAIEPTKRIILGG